MLKNTKQRADRTVQWAKEPSTMTDKLSLIRSDSQDLWPLTPTGLAGHLCWHSFIYISTFHTHTHTKGQRHKNHLSTYFWNNFLLSLRYLTRKIWMQIWLNGETPRKLVQHSSGCVQRLWSWCIGDQIKRGKSSSTCRRHCAIDWGPRQKTEGRRFPECSHWSLLWLSRAIISAIASRHQIPASSVFDCGLGSWPSVVLPGSQAQNEVVPLAPLALSLQHRLRSYWVLQPASMQLPYSAN